MLSIKTFTSSRSNLPQIPEKETKEDEVYHFFKNVELIQAIGTDVLCDYMKDLAQASPATFPKAVVCGQDVEGRPFFAVRYATYNAHQSKTALQDAKVGYLQSVGSSNGGFDYHWRTDSPRQDFLFGGLMGWELEASGFNQFARFIKGDYTQDPIKMRMFSDEGEAQFKIVEAPQPKLTLETLPQELNLLMLSYVGYDDNNESLETICTSNELGDWATLARRAEVWQPIDLKQLFPMLTIFNEHNWNKSFDVSLLASDWQCFSQLHKRTAIHVLKPLFALPQGEDLTLKLLTIPKGLTFNKLADFGNSSTTSEKIFPVNKDIPVKATYTIVIATGYISQQTQTSSLSEGWKSVEPLESAIFAATRSDGTLNKDSLPKLKHEMFVTGNASPRIEKFAHCISEKREVYFFGAKVLK